MSFDIMNPQISVVAKGLEGKVLLTYGGNSRGKTYQSTRMKKPFHLGFENGLNGIAGVPFLPLNSWSDFKKINKQLTNQKTLTEVQEKYQTIIFDEVYAASLYCQYYVCSKYDAETMSEQIEGANLYQEYEKEWLREINKLIKCGYTIVFIGHEESFVVNKSTKEEQIRPKGSKDKRSMGVIIDNADIIIYLKSNGVDENGRVVKSSGYLAETPDFFARTRFDYIDTYIPEYTAENLEKAIIEAIERQEKKEGIKAVSFQEQKETKEPEALDFEQLKNQIKEVGTKLVGQNKHKQLKEVIEDKLGKGKEFKDFTKSHVEIMSVVLDDLNDLLQEEVK